MSNENNVKRLPEWKPNWSDAPPPSPKQSSRTFLYAIVMGVVVVALVPTLVFLIDKKSSNSAIWVVVSSSVGLATAATAVLFVSFNQRSTVTSVRIAVLGLPRVGKTTLITACFQEIFSRRINIRAIMSGARSFESLNENVSRLTAGLPLNPTTDQDVTAYRFEIDPSRFLTPRYRVEFGDFPGQDTEAYAAAYGPWLHRTPFFEWALTCDAFVFCIDSGPLARLFQLTEDTIGKPSQDKTDKKPAIYSESSVYVNNSSATVRAAWQHIVASFGDRRATYLRQYPLLLVFTKLDLLFRPPNVEQAPHTIEISESDADRARIWLNGQFGDLVRYLQGETSNFSVVATSSFATTNLSRCGINGFLHKILPSRAFASSSASER